MKNKIINIEPEILNKDPLFYRTRIPMKNLFDYIETGETLENFLGDFPSVTREQALNLFESAEELLIENISGK